MLRFPYQDEPEKSAMPKRAFVPPKIAPLQRIVAEPVTDPVEIAAFEKFRKRQKRKQSRSAGDRKIPPAS
jgi:hypothetical protein